MYLYQTNNNQQSTTNNQVKLEVMRCPTCGEKLKYQEGDTEVVCMACGNTYTINRDRKERNDNIDYAPAGLIKIDGIKTSSSGLAYVEQFLDSYDWEAFAFDSDFHIEQLDTIIENLKVDSADDYKTWVACFVSRVVPFSKKIEFRSKLFDEIIQEFKNDNLDAYGMYDAYKLVSVSLIESYESLIKEAEKYIEYAKKYGIPQKELASLEAQLKSLSLKDLNKTIYESIKDIPEIASFLNDREEKLVKSLEEKGINADDYYLRSLELINEEKYIEALDLLYSLRNYKDVNDIIDRINKLFTLSDEIFINEGHIYYLEKGYNGQRRYLYKEKDNEISEKPLATDVATIVTSYADNLFYFDNDNTLMSINLSSGKIVTVNKNSFEKKYYIKKAVAKAYFLFKSFVSNNHSELYEVDLKKASSKKIADGIGDILSYNGNYALCGSYYEKGSLTKKSQLINLESGEKIALELKVSKLIGFIDNNVIFTVNSPIEYNKDLYSFDLESKEKLVLERNVADDATIINGRIYYFTVDNLYHRYLIAINKDGTNRIELSPYSKELLFASGDWLYFIKSFRYNSALCKMRKDGSNNVTIASQIDEFVKIDNGYLYYIDDNRTLHKVRMDGTRNSKLCYSVGKVLKISNDGVIYEANEKNGKKSIYSIQFNSSGHRKVSYDIETAGLYDDNTIYLINNVDKSADESALVQRVERYLSKIDLSNYSQKRILKLKPPVTQYGCYVATCVYGSYDCPEVWMLRRYRDYYLDNRWWGRLFIKIYYFVSPTIVKLFGKTKPFNVINKYILDKKIKKLYKEGYEDTFYNDKY